MDVGARLRQVRMATGLSQRALARRAGVTNATISLIESNSISPSVGALKRVLDGIPIGMSEFFSVSLVTPRKFFFQKDELLEIGKGGLSLRQVGDNLRDSSLQILSEYYEPGADTGRVFLSHDGEEGGVVIRGRVEVTVGEQRRTLAAGDAYHFPSRIPHRFRNAADEPAEIVSALTPPTF
jgi:transcriptional regulator with XRE-family HTH domain